MDNVMLVAIAVFAVLFLAFVAGFLLALWSWLHKSIKEEETRIEVGSKEAKTVWPRLTVGGNLARVLVVLATLVAGVMGLLWVML
jgi:hypothetical protein